MELLFSNSLLYPDYHFIFLIILLRNIIKIILKKQVLFYVNDEGGRS